MRTTLRKTTRIALLVIAAVCFAIAAAGVYPIASFVALLSKGLSLGIGWLGVLAAFTVAIAIHGGAALVGLECLARRQQITAH